MPISTENMARYPGGSIKSQQWQAIRAFIRARAGDCCEQCGIRNLTYGCRIDGKFTDLGLDKEDAQIEYDFAIGICRMMSNDNADLSVLPKMIRIVCTVAHLDHSLTDHSAANLRFWCQQCHNRHDAKSRQVNASITRKHRSGQLELIGEAA